MPGRQPTIPDHEVLHLFAVSEAPVLTPGEVISELDMTRQGAYARFKSLEEDGLLDSKSVGSSARVWWLTDDGRAIVDEAYFPD